MAVTTLICAGSAFNTVGRAAAASTGFIVLTDQSAIFPPAGLYDGLASQAARFLTTSSAMISVDKNIVVNGTMETAATSSASVLASWVVDSGAVSRTSAQQSRGTFSMQLGAAGGSAHQDVTVNADERFTISAALRGDVTNAAKVQVQNLQTFSYFTSSGGWQAAQTFCITGGTAAAWTTTFRTGNVETYSPSVLEDTMVLRITASASTGTVFADDVILSPATTLVALIGFMNLDPGIVAKVVSSSDNFTTQTTETTMAQYTPSFYYYTSTPIDREYIRIYFAGVNSTQSGAIYGGELVLGQPTVLSRPFSPSLPIQFNDAQERQTTILGQQQVYRLGQQAVRGVSLPYVMTSLAEYRQIRDVLRRAQYGATPSVLIPSTTDPEVCLFGKFEQSWASIQDPIVWDQAVLKFVEMPFPVWIS